MQTVVLESQDNHQPHQINQKGWHTARHGGDVQRWQGLETLQRFE